MLAWKLRESAILMAKNLKLASWCWYCKGTAGRTACISKAASNERLLKLVRAIIFFFLAAGRHSLVVLGLSLPYVVTARLCTVFASNNLVKGNYRKPLLEF